MVWTDLYDVPFVVSSQFSGRRPMPNQPVDNPLVFSEMEASAGKAISISDREPGPARGIRLAVLAKLARGEGPSMGGNQPLQSRFQRHPRILATIRASNLHDGCMPAVTDRRA